MEDFESFIVGNSVHGQGGWTVKDSFTTNPFDPSLTDESVVQEPNGNKVFRLSNSIASGGFSDKPWSQSAPLIAGEVLLYFEEKS